ncbi:bifunctional homocysteine S-methyltransferase/methylenetetrahydrofolate reductase [Pseudonocardia kujensis]|uniref:bifunctional homocysteine S-methyltransferase/methylenetetrahydrofolate reductase n=1 Tax=Pseudonocardia kujensis TaxID=1128675 RepID=UPI001E49BF19|nr:bifunctional homocysteine S-methyltransferase/methylenetetrahydrofolate reductase [Pseudonocardia kujensis]MCE0768455.1 bifunctional homocysteine S-methyltransferase/methylenetetrahydrofolate reductase [Pseudonocardia kujensis]
MKGRAERDVRARLTTDVLVCDGAMGTMLHAAGNALDQSLPALSLSDPDLVRAVHTSYVDAGVDMIQTNTFGASRLRLDEYGLAELTPEINRRAVQLARDAAQCGRPVLVAGSVSPAVSVQQRRRTSSSDRLAALDEQITALVEADVDLIILETFGYLDELVEAVDLAVRTDVPIIAQATFGHDHRMLSGHSPQEMTEALSGMPIAAVGTNCTLGPQGLLSVVRGMREHTDLILTGQPNAGLPRRVGPARFEYDIDSAYFVRYVGQLLELGVSLVGGCCGTTPSQLGAVVEVVKEHRERAASRARAVHASPSVTLTTMRRGRVPLADSTSPVVVELSPELAGGVDESEDLARQLAQSGIEMVSVAAGTGLRAQMDPINLAVHLTQRLGIETMATVTTWDRTIMALQADLLGAHALGLRRVISETGSPPLLGDYPHVDGIWDVDSVGLIELLVGLNNGRDSYGLSLPTKTAFEIGARINPGHHDVDLEAARARAKIAAGAHFLITRPVYEVDGLQRLLDLIGDERPPVLAALRPLAGFEEAEYLAHEVPDVHIPATVRAALERAGSAGSTAGLDLAVELATQVRYFTEGLFLIPTTDPVTTVRLLAAI